MDPLKIDSKDEEISLFKLIQQKRFSEDKYYHTGGMLVDNQWKWESDLSRIFPNMSWAIGAPNNYDGQERCLSIKKDIVNVDVGFSDVRCKDYMAGYFCQKPKNQRRGKEFIKPRMQKMECRLKMAKLNSNQL